MAHDDAPRTPITADEIERRFSYHPANTPERREAHERVRAAAKELGHALNALLPAGRDAATAFTKLEESMFWANAALARTPDGPPAPAAGE